MSYPPQSPAPYGQPGPAPQPGPGYGPPVSGAPGSGGPAYGAPGHGGPMRSGTPYPTSPAAGQFPGTPASPSGPAAITPLFWAALGASVLAFLLFGVSFLLNWVVAKSGTASLEAGVGDILDDGNTLNQLLAIMYFLFSFAGMALAGVVAFVPAALRKSFAFGAVGAAVLDLIAVLVLGYRILDVAETSRELDIEVSFGVGWFLGVGVSLVLFVAAGLVLAAVFKKHSPPSYPGAAPYQPPAGRGHGPPAPGYGPPGPQPGYGPAAPGYGPPGPQPGQPPRW